MYLDKIIIYSIKIVHSTGYPLGRTERAQEKIPLGSSTTTRKISNDGNAGFSSEEVQIDNTLRDIPLFTGLTRVLWREFSGLSWEQNSIDIF